MESISESNTRRIPAAIILTTNSTIPSLQAVVAANLRFVIVDVGGAYGKQKSYGGIFRYSALYQSLETRSLKLSEDTVLPNSAITLPYVFVGDEAYTLTTYLI